MEDSPPRRREKETPGKSPVEERVRGIGQSAGKALNRCRFLEET
jgi:hypothetical protein